MDIIYHSCIRVVILLEDVLLDEREARLHEKYDLLNENFDKTWQPEGAEREDFISFYHKVNAARWWQRAWCLHEFGVNDPWIEKRQCNEIHNATFILNGPRGSTVNIKWYNLHQIMASALHMLPTIVGGALNSFNGEYIFSGAERGDEIDDGLRSSLMSRHHGVIQKGSQFLRDRVSIVLNMRGLGLAYLGEELQSEDDVLYFSTLLALSRGEAFPLSMFNSELITLGATPTWLMRNARSGVTSIPRFRPRRLSGIHQITAQHITLDMIFFEEPRESVTDAQVSATYEIFPDNIPTTPSPRRVGTGTSDIPPNRYRDEGLEEISRRRFLAACIANGYAFTSRLWHQLKHEVVIPNYNTGLFADLVPNPGLRDAARNLLRRIVPVSKLPCISSPQSFIEDDAHLFLTWLTDPRSMYYIGIYTYCVPCTPTNDQAFITAVHVNTHFTKGPEKDLRFTVPTDLLEENCMALRVWILRPANEENGKDNWRIVGKALLLGEPDLLHEAKKSAGCGGAALRLRERVVVGG
ncbi:hypothetical protein ACEQ8H_008080 [Pleosporales sp. CAS-2024a]